MGYDPNQPRAPKGSPIGGQWIDSARAAAGVKDDSELRYDTYMDFRATKFVGKELPDGMRHESAWLVDEQGEVIFKQDGRLNKVNFTEDQKGLMKGQYLVHNHLQESGLSRADIKFGWVHNLAEIVAITPEGAYKLNYINLPEDNWERYKFIGRLDLTIDMYSSVLWNKHEAEIAQGTLTWKEANAKHNYELLNRIILMTEFGQYLEHEFIPWEGD
jgi:hypothetical protein